MQCGMELLTEEERCTLMRSCVRWKTAGEAKSCGVVREPSISGEGNTTPRESSISAEGNTTPRESSISAEGNTTPTTFRWSLRLRDGRDVTVQNTESCIMS